MPGILFRSIFLELGKVLLVTTSVLVTVIAFAAAIKPLSENLLSPGDLLRYMAYATVPMLQYALPFSAAFAGTIVYHRLATDNEILAMAVSGIPYRRILRPAVALGIVLTVVMAIIVDVGVPSFWAALKRLTASDLTKLLLAQIERGEALTKVPGVQIFADEAFLAEVPPGSTASQRIILGGVVAIEVDRQQRPTREFTARAATIDVYRDAESAGGGSYLKLALSDATLFSRGDNSIAGAAVVRPDAIDLGQGFDFGPKGLRFLELLEFRRHLDRFPEIANRRIWVRQALDADDAWRAIAAELRERGAFTLRGTGDADDTTFVVEAGGVEGGVLLPRSDGQILIRQEVVRADGATELRSEILAPAIELSIEPPDATTSIVSAPRFDLVADDAAVRDGRAEGRPVRRPVRLAELGLDGFRPVDRAALLNSELIDEAARRVAAPEPGAPVAGLARLEGSRSELVNRTKYYSDEVVARISQRVAQALTAILMLLAGSILAILFRSKSALVVYMVAFLPAILCILLISGGEQMLRRDVSITGFLVIASGNAVMLATCLWGAWKVGRH